MTASLPEVEQTEAQLEARPTRIPGLAALRATSGFQRGMLVAGVLIMLFFVVLAVFAPAIAPYGFNADSATSRRSRRRPRSTGSAPPSAARTCFRGSCSGPERRSRSSSWPC
jgi:ABC-type dipeptide/oligopeptide/nickel transport system permease subunit